MTFIYMIFEFAMWAEYLKLPWHTALCIINGVRVEDFTIDPNGNTPD